MRDPELGCTDILQHCNDTGDHPLIKQRPAVRYEKMSEMIDAMEKQSVVQPTTSPWQLPWS